MLRLSSYLMSSVFKQRNMVLDLPIRSFSLTIPLLRAISFVVAESFCHMWMWMWVWVSLCVSVWQARNANVVFLYGTQTSTNNIPLRLCLLLYKSLEKLHSARIKQSNSSSRSSSSKKNWLRTVDDVESFTYFWTKRKTKIKRTRR